MSVYTSVLIDTEYLQPTWKAVDIVPPRNGVFQNLYFVLFLSRSFTLKHFHPVNMSPHYQLCRQLL